MQHTPSSSNYLDTVFELLGEQDPLDVQAQLVPSLRRLLAGIDAERLSARQAPDKWSLLEIVEHLVDAETVHAFRIRMVLCHDTPPLSGYDQDAFVARLRYSATSLEQLLAELALPRARNLRLLRDLSTDELKRESVHGERGRESLRTTVAIIAGHDLIHLRQIERVRNAVSIPGCAQRRTTLHP